MVFKTLKEKLMSAPLVSYPYFDDRWIGETDASGNSVGGGPTQKNSDRKLHPLYFEIRKMNSAEGSYSTCERETPAVIRAIRKVRVYSMSENIPLSLQITSSCL